MNLNEDIIKNEVFYNFLTQNESKFKEFKKQNNVKTNYIPQIKDYIPTPFKSIKTTLTQRGGDPMELSYGGHNFKLLKTKLDEQVSFLSGIQNEIQK